MAKTKKTTIQPQTRILATRDENFHNPDQSLVDATSHGILWSENGDTMVNSPHKGWSVVNNEQRYQLRDRDGRLIDVISNEYHPAIEYRDSAAFELVELKQRHEKMFRELMET